MVEDIYKLFDGADLDSEKTEKFGARLAELLKARFASYKEPRKEYLRFSNLGKNPLQLWYDIKGTHEVESPSGADKLKFLYGDIIEELILFLAEAAGHEVTDRQKQVELDGVKGSIDGLIDGELIDVKSASSFALSKFTNEASLRAGDSFGYVEQISGYAQSLGRDRGTFVAVGKDDGQIKLCTIETDDVRPRIRELRDILSKDEPPYSCSNDRELGGSGNRVLAYPCTYCKHKNECWKDSNGGKGLQRYEYADGVKYFTNVAKEPRVNKKD